MVLTTGADGGARVRPLASRLDAPHLWCGRGTKGRKLVSGAMTASTEQISGRDRLLVGLLCGVAWLPVGVVRGGYSWDDWVLSVAEPDDLREHGRELGRLFPLSREVFLSLGAPGVRVITVAALVVTGLSILQIGHRFRILTRRELTFVAVVAAVNPLDTCKSLLATATYSWSVAFFFLGWRLLSSHRSWPAALPLFVLSFDTNSLLVFAVLPFVDVLQQFRTPRQRLAVARALGITLTVLGYGVIRFVVRRPYGTYEGYNSPGAFAFLFTVLSISGIAVVAIALSKPPTFAEDLRRGSAGLGAIGVLMVLLGLIPYIALRYLPPYVMTDTRHFLLVGPGLSLCLVALARAVHRVIGRGVTVRGLLTCTVALSIGFVWFNAFLSLHYWRATDQIRTAADQANLPTGALVIVDFEETPASLLSQWIGPNFADSWYAWTHLLNDDGKRDNFAFLEHQYSDYLAGDFSNAYGIRRDYWGVEGFEPSTTAIRLEITSVGGFLGFFGSYDIKASAVKVDVPQI